MELTKKLKEMKEKKNTAELKTDELEDAQHGLDMKGR